MWAALRRAGHYACAPPQDSRSTLHTVRLSSATGNDDAEHRHHSPTSRHTPGHSRDDVRTVAGLSDIGCEEPQATSEAPHAQRYGAVSWASSAVRHPSTLNASDTGHCRPSTGQPSPRSSHTGYTAPRGVRSSEHPDGSSHSPMSRHISLPTLGAPGGRRASALGVSQPGSVVSGDSAWCGGT